VKNREKSETHHLIYQSIQDKTRIRLKDLARILGLSGRGRTTQTASRHLQEMYELKITFYPNLILRAYENSYVTAYFLRAKSRKAVTKIFKGLQTDPQISYVIFLSGQYDFFVTSRQEQLNLEKFDVSIVKKSCMYTPVFAVPQGWNNEMRECLKSLTASRFEKGVLGRELEDFLPWEELDWQIFHSMMFNARKKFTEVGREVGVTSDTVKRHFNRSVLPYCDVAHYFFPKGYDHYDRSFVIAHSDYEKDFVSSLGKLPCTSYVYPLEEELALILFHEGINGLITAFQKLEEVEVIRDYLLLVPVWHWWI